MKTLLLLAAAVINLSAAQGHAASTASHSAGAAAVTVSEGVLTIPTYEHTGRYLDPPLFSRSTMTGLYPFTTYQREWKPGSPSPESYPAVFVENDYVKLTYIPELGGRFFALYDKLRHREVFYRNDVIKPTQFNPRFSWPQSGLELTGPYDAHTLTLHNEPYWSHTILRNADGSVSVLLGETDPIYHMDVTYTATIVPGVAGLKISTFCYNPNDGEEPQMLWTNASFRVTPKLRFLYPMTETVGHTTGVVSPWPVYKGVDLSWAHNNMHMLGVFGIDSYDNYGGSYEFDHDYGVFRYADRRDVQGMKMWTFGFGAGSSDIEHSYTDKAGPYFEAQSGRMVWDGHYEWVSPHQVEQWHEWWIPVAGIGGLTTLSENAGLNLDVKADPAGKDSSIHVRLSPVRASEHATLVVKAQGGELLSTLVDLVPGTPVEQSAEHLAQTEAGLKQMEVLLTAPDGKVLLDYRRPDGAAGGHVTPFAKGLEEAPIPLDKMTAQQLVVAAEFKQKDLNTADAARLANLALKIDSGYSVAHRLLGMLAFNDGHFEQAKAEFEKAVDRDPYDTQAWYYLSVCEIKLGQQPAAENHLYYIWPGSAYFGAREYQLGRLAFLRNDADAATQHLLGAIRSNGQDMNARLLLAISYRDQGNKQAALDQLGSLRAVDPANSVAQAERFFLTQEPSARQELSNLTGDQSEDAIELSIFYSSLLRWKEAVAVLKFAEPPHNKDPWGTAPIYYYTLAYDEKRAGEVNAAAANREKARHAAGIVERFPYRPESVAALEDAVKETPSDVVARFDLACLLYSLGHRADAIGQWKASNEINPSDFASRRALGLAYEEQGNLQDAIPQLEKAVDLRAADSNTFDDLAELYARTGRFDQQLALLKKALAGKPNDDHLMEAVLNAYLIQGDFQATQQIIDRHTFQPVHRTYALRDAYRQLESGLGSRAFNQGQYQQALDFFHAALKPPASLGMDDFESQSSSQIDYFIGRTLEAMGRHAEAKQAYERSIQGVDGLTGGGSEDWTPDNFYMVFALDRLGRRPQALELVKEFRTAADSRLESDDRQRSAAAHYLNGLIDKFEQNRAEANKQMQLAIEAEPDYIAPRFEMRGDVIDPLKANDSARSEVR